MLFPPRDLSPAITPKSPFAIAVSDPDPGPGPVVVSPGSRGRSGSNGVHRYPIPQRRRDASSRVVITLEEFGPDLKRTRFNEVMLAPFDQIADLELLPRKRSLLYLELLWLNYQQAALANQPRH